jgi:hypothetical protein
MYRRAFLAMHAGGSEFVGWLDVDDDHNNSDGHRCESCADIVHRAGVVR